MAGLLGCGMDDTVADRIRGRQSIRLWCRQCRHAANLDLEALPPEMRMAAVWPRLACSVCQARDIGVTISVRDRGDGGYPAVWGAPQAANPAHWRSAVISRVCKGAGDG